MQKGTVKKQTVYVTFMPHHFNEKAQSFYEKLIRWAFGRLKKGFAHVSLWIPKKDESGMIEVNCCSNNLFVNEISNSEFVFFLALPEITHLKTVQKDDGIKPKGLITCVSMAKHFLGINKWWIITPWQLYQYIERKNHGGKTKK